MDVILSHWLASVCGRVKGSHPQRFVQKTKGGEGLAELMEVHPAIR